MTTGLGRWRVAADGRSVRAGGRAAATARLCVATRLAACRHLSVVSVFTAVAASGIAIRAYRRGARSATHASPSNMPPRATLSHHHLHLHSTLLRAFLQPGYVAALYGRQHATAMYQAFIWRRQRLYISPAHLPLSIARRRTTGERKTADMHQRTSDLAVPAVSKLWFGRRSLTAWNQRAGRLHTPGGSCSFQSDAERRLWSPSCRA